MVFPRGIVDWEEVSEFISEAIVEKTKNDYVFSIASIGNGNRSLKKAIHWEVDDYGHVKVDYTPLYLSEEDAIEIIKKHFQQKLSKHDFDIFNKKLEVGIETCPPMIEVLSNAYDGLLEFEFDVYQIIYFGIGDLLSLLQIFDPQKYQEYRLVHAVIPQHGDADFIKEEQKEEIIETIHDAMIDFQNEITSPLRDYLKKYKKEIENIIKTTIEYYEGTEFLRDELLCGNSLIYEKVKFSASGDLIFT